MMNLLAGLLGWKPYKNRETQVELLFIEIMGFLLLN